jgi:hypothetical protein
MKYEKYVKPELEELELALEGSFLTANSEPLGKNDEEYEGNDWD